MRVGLEVSSKKVEVAHTLKTKNNFNKEPVFNPLESCSRIGMPTAKKGIQESKTAE